MTDERIEVGRTVAADPAAIFRVLADPAGHVTIDSSGMLMSATGDPVTAVGDTFVVHMDREALNDYPMGEAVPLRDGARMALDAFWGLITLIIILLVILPIICSIHTTHTCHIIRAVW